MTKRKWTDPDEIWPREGDDDRHRMTWDTPTGLPEPKMPTDPFETEEPMITATRNRSSWPAGWGDPTECPKCQGHGKHKATSHDGREYVVHCMQCNGWGLVTKGSLDETCEHDWKRLPARRMFDKPYECTKCGQTVAYDSSG